MSDGQTPAHDQLASKHTEHQARHSSASSESLQSQQADILTATVPTRQSLLGDARLNGRGNQPVRVALMRQMQQTYGNRATLRAVQRSCGRTSAQFKTQFDMPGINQGGGLAHAATVHGSDQGNIRKGAFFTGTTDEDIYGMAQRILQASYDDGTLHVSHVDATGAVASRFKRSLRFSQHVGYSRNTGESTNKVECVFALTKYSEATIVTIYPA